MAGNIKLRENEYNQMVDKMAEFYSNEISKIEAVIKEIKDASNNKDIFATDETSNLIDTLMEIIQTKIVNELKLQFSSSETVVASYIEKQQQVDDRTA